jgi:C4-dicarboxylate-specific signal transduction histidine kinase
MDSASAAPLPHLLLVDDEPVILQILRAVFQEEPYRLTAVGTGSEALSVLADQGCDVLLTDKNLPDVSGLELLKAAKAKDHDIEVIVITGYGSLETALTAMELGAFDYVLKPLNNVFDIRRKVRQALDRQNMTRENRRLVAHLSEKNQELESALAESQKLQAELIQSEKLAGIGTLAAGIAHEVSSPLFGVMGLAEAILDEHDPALVNGYARDIVEYSRTIRDIVMELSSYSRSATTEYLTTVELARVIEDALRLVERSCPVDGVRFETHLAEGLYLHARTNEMQQVFVNLIKNAVEAVNENKPEGGGKVVISAGTSDGVVWAEVADQGGGIPADRVPLIFDPFYTTKPVGKGTGLGLNVVYRILTKYRGAINVQSTGPDGTVFRLRIPVQG